MIFGQDNSVNKFGRNPDVDTSSSPEDIWDAGGLWVPPNEARIHDIVSTSIEDSGNVVASGIVNGGSTRSLRDDSVDFVALGIAANDTALDDTTKEHCTIISVTENVLTLHPTRHGSELHENDLYRIVNPDATGASVVHVIGLGEDMTEQEEFVVMDGTTNVPTLNKYWRIFELHIDGASSRIINNVGDITATAQVDGTVTAKMLAGNGQNAMAVYTVPFGKSGYIHGFWAMMKRDVSASGTVADITLNITPFASVGGAGSRVVRHISLAFDGSSHVQHKYKPKKKILEQTDIWVRCEAVSKNDVDISAGFDLELIPN